MSAGWGRSEHTLLPPWAALRMETAPQPVASGDSFDSGLRAGPLSSWSEGPGKDESIGIGE